MARLLSFILLFVAYCHAQRWDDESWMSVVDELHTEISLDCFNKSYVNYTWLQDAPEAWMLPDLTVLYVNDTSQNHGKFSISPDGWNLSISNITTDDFGQYHCMMMTEDTGEWFLIKLGLNMKGPYFEDMWEKYMMNTIIGLSSFFGFLLMCLALWVIYRFRWEPEEEDKELELDQVSHTGYGQTNKAYLDAYDEVKVADTDTDEEPGKSEKVPKEPPIDYNVEMDEMLSNGQVASMTPVEIPDVTEI